jgi:hypothetical protein
LLAATMRQPVSVGNYLAAIIRWVVSAIYGTKIVHHGDRNRNDGTKIIYHGHRNRNDGTKIIHYSSKNSNDSTRIGL